MAVHEQLENLFQTRVNVDGEIASMIVGGGSKIDYVSSEFVKNMCLASTKHPLPYKLSWLEDIKNTTVRRQCLVRFVIGTYHDERRCCSHECLLYFVRSSMEK